MAEESAFDRAQRIFYEAREASPAAPEPDNSPTDAALDWAALEDRDPPARRWAEPGWLGFGHATLLAGEGGIGKTLLAQQIASAFAIGDRLLHQKAEPLRTLMWACEDDHDELWRRQLDICRWLGCRLGDMGNFHLKPRVGLDNALLYAEFGKPALTPLVGKLRAQADAIDADVVMLDNIAQLYAGNENDRSMVTYFVNALVGELRGRAVVFLGHPSKGLGSEFSGSTAWEAAVRSRLYFANKMPGDRSEGESDSRILARRKANYATKDSRRFTYQNGVFVPEAAATELDVQLQNEAEEGKIILAFKYCAAQEPPIPVPASAKGPNTFIHAFRLVPFLQDMQLDSRRHSQRITGIVEKMQANGILERYEFIQKYKRPLLSLRVK